MTTDLNTLLTSLYVRIDDYLARIAQRLLALTAAIWHNRATGQPVTRSLIAYDH
uniref:hypothetical protein n=1 Tax=Klenkia terrae TaxID=1052259 RepID=UPI0038511B19